MIKNVLTSIGGIGLYGVISVCLFFLVFSVAFVRACLLEKQFLNSMSVLPLDDGVRPSSAAATFPTSVATEPSPAIQRHRNSAPGDGRTPAAQDAGSKGTSSHE